jgi:hypothetical protein
MRWWHGGEAASGGRLGWGLRAASTYLLLARRWPRGGGGCRRAPVVCHPARWPLRSCGLQLALVSSGRPWRRGEDAVAAAAALLLRQSRCRLTLSRWELFSGDYWRCSAIAPDQKPVGQAPRRCVSPSVNIFCSESVQVVRPRWPGAGCRRSSPPIWSERRTKESIVLARFP